MATNKNQHFVPRCYLRQFTIECEDKAINLYNIDRDRYIQGAPVKNQCSGDYFYGQDDTLESAIQSVEHAYSSAIRAILARNYNLTDEHRQTIRLFWLLQYLRTEAASKRAVEVANDMASIIDPSEQSFRIQIKEAVQDAMQTFAEEMDSVSDLKVCLLKNRTSMPFVTSDDPAVLTNRWHFVNPQKTGLSFGINSAGALMLLPLSPEVICIMYDGDMYSIPNNNGWSEIRNVNDIYALNQHQFLNCRANIFIRNPDHFTEIRDTYHRVRASRLPSRHRLNYAVFDGTHNGHSRYVVVDRQQAGQHQHAMIHIQILHAKPNLWPNTISWRFGAHYYYNGTGVGYIRKHFTRRAGLEFNKIFAFKGRK